MRLLSAKYFKMAFLFGEMETQAKEQAHLLRKIVNSSKKRNLLFEMNSSYLIIAS